MAVESEVGAMAPVMAFALVGALGVGSQWVAWRLRMPAIVLMLVAGVLIGPVAGVFDPARDIGPLMAPMISIAVAIILFEGGLTLNFHSLSDAAKGVRRLVFIGAPLGWLTSALALRYGAGLSWESAAVFGGIMIVTGPTVIAPLLRTARLSKRPAALLQWEAIVNDPIGALAAVLAFEVVLVMNTATTVNAAIMDLVIGIGFATLLGVVAGYGLARAFKRGLVPEYMKVPVLFALLLGIFGLSDHVLHESGLLAVTIMGIVIANANLPSYEELRRFKEHATVLLVSGVFILLAASLDFSALRQLDFRAFAFVALVVLVARPLTVFVALLGSGVPYKEQILVAFTGPRGVVLVAVAGLFGDRLIGLGFEDAPLIAPLAFVLVAFTVVLHGFTLAPFARWLGLTGADVPGVVVIGGSKWTTAFAAALKKADVPVLMTDPNFGNLRSARAAGIPTFSGDILSEAAEQRLELISYATLVAATDNDAYNTLVATDLAPEFGRDSVFQVMRAKNDSARHQLPRTLGGRKFGPEETHHGLEALIAQGWTFRVTRLTEEYTLQHWRQNRPEAHLFARIDTAGAIKLIRKDEEVKPAPDVRIIAMRPPGDEDGEQPPADS
ncbi:sodium:proton antiporter [Loktanella sp. D2R18]|uniref:cation:proton antiporter n=1 Tax=Rhodobacterales TaxID=204455 RepID=UPI000DE95652|nr:MULTISPECIES: sodium:proton antiporter [Rhodobacterales]MDO6589657.1 sodium:proton antiporter [Yoonia sp. 1_MG-2023]RBW44289.1 sodium:proton antiporter [Loktanella sp. D2R18]